MATADDSGSDSVEHLWELVRFVRREKDIAETKKEMAEDENVRLTQSNKHLERKLQETELQLQELSEVVKVGLVGVGSFHPRRVIKFVASCTDSH